MKGRVLVIDDDRKLCGLLTEYLGDAGFEIRTAQRVDEGLRVLRAWDPQIVVLDVMLPDVDGFEGCRAIRKISGVPVIMLTARGDVTDRVVGLELGADDYMAKPFEPRELVARIQAVLRRGRSAEQIWSFGALRVDPQRRSAFLDDQALPLTTAEFDLLELLIRSRGRVLTRAGILDGMRGEPWAAYDRSIDVLVSRLRQKLADDAHRPRYIRTVRGAGYSFIGGGRDEH